MHASLAAPPRYASVPPSTSSLADEAIELAELAGLKLDPWQIIVLRAMLALNHSLWAAFEVAMCVSRQNGKGGILEARELAGLYLIKTDRMITHSAHLFDTSLEAFFRLLMLIEQTPDLDREVAKVSRSHGEEGLTLRDGSRIRFRTRTAGGGRGFSGDLVVFDEAMYLPETSVGALMPTVSARVNPQLVYAASAVDQRIHEHGHVLARLRARGISGEDPSLAWLEWSPDIPAPDPDRDLRPDDITEDIAADPALWIASNPALNIRIRPEHVENELRSMALRTFVVERLNIGDWPKPDTGGVIPPEAWDALERSSTMVDPVCFAFDVNPDRSYTSIAAAGASDDRIHAHLEIVDHRRGTNWFTERAVQLAAKHDHIAWVYDGSSPAASLAPALEEAGLTLHPVTAAEHAAACGLIFDTVQQAGLVHLGDPAMKGAIRGAKTRPLGDGGWAWSRKTSAVDISPLVASTLALWGAVTLADDTPKLPRVY